VALRNGRASSSAGDLVGVGRSAVVAVLDALDEGGGGFGVDDAVLGLGEFGEEEAAAERFASVGCVLECLLVFGWRFSSSES
jgi:hypothetical protein